MCIQPDNKTDLLTCFLFITCLPVYSQISTFPNTTDFESGFGDWNQSSSDNFDNKLNIRNIEAIGEAMAITLNGWIDKKNNFLHTSRIRFIIKPEKKFFMNKSNGYYLRAQSAIFHSSESHEFIRTPEIVFECAETSPR